MSKPTATSKSGQVMHVRITLGGTKPPVWRQVALPSDITLGRMHEVIQIVMGWMNEHLHQFVLRDKGLKPTPQEMATRLKRHTVDDAFYSRMRGERVFVPRTDPMGGELDMDGEDEDTVTLQQVCPKPKSKLTYEYDFGDGWEHVIEVEKIIASQDVAELPHCLAGKNACPPEDCGGVWGYYEMLEALKDPSHEMHEHYVEWLGEDFDPAAFDLEEVNKSLAQWRKPARRRR